MNNVERDAADPLALDPVQMSELASKVVGLAIERVSSGRPVPPRVSRRETECRFGGPPPADPVPIDDLLLSLGDVAELIARTDHPGFFAFIPGQATWPAALAEFYASALDLHAINWLEAPGPSQLEL